MRTGTQRLRRQRRYRWGDTIDLVRTAVGRQQLRGAAMSRAWPVAYILGGLHRRTVGRNLPVVAVVGSYGKTTTARAAAAAVGSPREPDGYNTRTIVGLRLARTWPSGAPTVFETGIKWPGEMEGYARMLRPDIVVVTSIGSEHVRYLGAREVTRREKARMLEGMRPDGVALLNGDDPDVLWMRPRARGTVRTFGLGAGHDYAALDVELDWPRGTRFVVAGPGVHLPLRTRLMGSSMVRSLLAGAAVALELGIPAGRVVEGLEGLSPTPGRLQPHPLPHGAWMLRDDFKSGWETYEPALELFGQIPARRRIAALGNIGGRPLGHDEALYLDLGKRVAAVADHVAYWGDMPDPLFAGLSAGGLPGSSAVHCRSAHELAEHLAAELEPGDVVLLKGSTYQKLERVVLLLHGRTVRCDITAYCHASNACSVCPMLERGWRGRRVVI